MLESPFMAAIQIMVYAGAIMVLIVFVIMLLNLGTAVKARYTHGIPAAGVLAAIVLLLPTISSATVKQQEPVVVSPAKLFQAMVIPN